MNNVILSYEEIASSVPFTSRKNADKLNEIIQKKLISLGIVKDCENHRPVFKKLATIFDERFKARQYGYVCSLCERRLFPTQFTVFDAEKHSGLYQEPFFDKIKTP